MKRILLHINIIKQRVIGGFPLGLVLLVCSLFATNTANAQIIFPLDGATTLESQAGPESRVRAECTDADGNRLYVVYQNSVSKYTSELYKCEYTVGVWDGLAWGYLPMFTIITKDQESSIKSMIFYKDELYVGGNFEALDNVSNSAYLIKWDGTNWVSSGDFTIKDKGGINTLEVYNSKLIAGGHFERIGGVFATNLAEFDGTNWGFVGTTGIKQGVDINSQVFDMYVLNNILYVGGDFTTAGGDPTIRVMAEWDGTTWTSSKITLDECHVIGSHNGELYVYGNYNLKPLIYRMQGGSWLDITDPKFRVKSALTSFESYNGKLWVSGSYIDDADNSLRNLLSYDGIEWTIHKTDNLGIETPAVSYPMLTKTKHGLFISGPFTSNRNIDLKYVGKIEFGQGVIQGTVFNDLVSNCNRDNGEPGVAGRFVLVQPGDYFAMTDENGHFALKVPAGDYTLSVVQKDYWTTICPIIKNGIDISIAEDEIVTTQQIPTYAMDYMRDLEVRVNGYSGSKMKEGYTEKYLVCAKNLGTYNVTNIDLTVTADDRLKDFMFYGDPVKIEYNTATYRISVLKGDEEVCYAFTAKAPIEELNGKEVSFTASSNYIAADENKDNNSYVLKQVVKSAFDPNNKEVKDPSNTGSVYGDTIEIGKATQKLEYQINFQNTGNDTAYRVTIVDTVSLDHRYYLVEILTSSIPADIWSFRPEGNVFIWTFDGIMLPDSGTNFEGSKGFVTFNVSLRNEKAAGTVIRNKAYIYFDYQKPIETNEIRAKVSETEDVNPPVNNVSDFINIYPNPASDYVTLQNMSDNAHTLTITDVSGREMKTVEVLPNQTMFVNTSTFAKGVYFIKSEGAVAYKLVVY